MSEHFVYILLTDTGTIFTKTIKKFTKAPYNHVSISFSEDLSEIYSFGRKCPYNPLYAGFVEENLHNGTFTYFPRTTCALLKIPVTEEQLWKLKKQIELFLSKKNFYKYNMLGLLLVPFNVNFKTKKSYYCSQFVSELLKNADISKFNEEIVYPEDIRKEFGTHLVYEGALYSYPKFNNKNVKFNKYRYHIPFYTVLFRKQ